MVGISFNNLYCLPDRLLFPSWKSTILKPNQILKSVIPIIDSNFTQTHNYENSIKPGDKNNSIPHIHDNIMAGFIINE